MWHVIFGPQWLPTTLANCGPSNSSGSKARYVVPGPGYLGYFLTHTCICTQACSPIHSCTYTHTGMFTYAHMFINAHKDLSNVDTLQSHFHLVSRSLLLVATVCHLLTFINTAREETLASFYRAKKTQYQSNKVHMYWAVPKYTCAQFLFLPWCQDHSY